MEGGRERERELSGVSFSSYKDTNPIGLGPHPMTSFNPNYLPKALSPNAITLAVRASTYEFGGDTIQSVAHTLSHH